MFSCYFLRIIRQSIQVLCPVFSPKVFFRGVEGSNKVWTSKTSLSVSCQDFVEHGGRVISPAKHPEILHVLLVVTSDLLSESPNSIFGTSFFLREPINLPLQRVVWDCLRTSLKTNRTPVTQELYLDEKTMPHVYVIVSCIWARWEKSIENKISKRYCRVVQTCCLGRAPTNFRVTECQSFAKNHLFLPHMLLCGLGVYTWAATTLDEIAVYS